MEKTFYRRYKVYSLKNVWRVEFEFGDDEDGFFMPMTLEGDTKEEVVESFNNFIGKNAVFVTT